MRTKENIIEWLGRMTQKESLDKDIIAFNFGLFEGENGYMIYLVGSKEFDDENYDWAANEDFTPQEKYLPLTGDEFKDLDWEQALNQVKQLLSEYINSDDFQKSLLKEAKAITTGFDDGDLHRIR